VDANGLVICGIEDENGAGVARVARELAERYGLPLLYVHVLDGAADAEEALRLLGTTVAPGTGELAVEYGHPADQLVALAHERDASFLVVGNHGPRSSLLGSVSADVSRRAPCPVIVVPPDAETGSARDEHELEGGSVRFDVRRAVRGIA
jgi:nucleotide-binding universal stress UspA family protein